MRVERLETVGAVVCFIGHVFHRAKITGWNSGIGTFCLNIVFLFCCGREI